MAVAIKKVSAVSNIGTNIQSSLEDGVLVLRINLKERHGPSASGKTTIIATSSGNKEVAPGIIIGVNCYTKAK